MSRSPRRAGPLAIALLVLVNLSAWPAAPAPSATPAFAAALTCSTAVTPWLSFVGRPYQRILGARKIIVRDLSQAAGPAARVDWRRFTAALGSGVLQRPSALPTALGLRRLWQWARGVSFRRLPHESEDFSPYRKLFRFPTAAQTEIFLDELKDHAGDDADAAQVGLAIDALLARENPGFHPVETALLLFQVEAQAEVLSRMLAVGALDHDQADEFFLIEQLRERLQHSVHAWDAYPKWEKTLRNIYSQADRVRGAATRWHSSTPDLMSTALYLYPDGGYDLHFEILLPRDSLDPRTFPYVVVGSHGGVAFQKLLRTSILDPGDPQDGALQLTYHAPAPGSGLASARLPLRHLAMIPALLLSGLLALPGVSDAAPLSSGSSTRALRAAA